MVKIINNSHDSVNAINLSNKINFKNVIDKQFFQRVYSTPNNTYLNRLKSIKLNNQTTILDAGCGFGQWTRGISDLNKNVFAMDLDYYRVNITKKIITEYQKDNVYLNSGSIENLPYRNNIFDAIFSYSVIYWTDYKKSLKEFYRVLKPKGFIYFVANGIGWSIFNLVTGHSSASDYNARKVAIDTIFQTIRYSFTGKKKKNSSLFLSPKKVSNFMRNIGFKNVMVAEEGHLQLLDNVKSSSFYPKRYLGLDNVFEIWGEK